MARILVHEVRANTPGESGATIAQRYVEGAQAIFQEVREVESTVGSAGEMPAYQQQLEAQVLNVPVKARLLAVNAGETGIVVVGAASAASEPTYRPVLAAVLESFRVSGAPVPPSASLTYAGRAHRVGRAGGTGPHPSRRPLPRRLPRLAPQPRPRGRPCGSPRSRRLEPRRFRRATFRQRP